MQATGSPQDIVRVDDLLAKMRAGTREVYEISLRELKIPVRILAIDELAAIRRDAKKNVAIIQGDDSDQALFVQKAVLRLASNVTKGGAPILSDKLLSMLSVDEINFLYDEYIAVQDQVNPRLETITPEQFRAIVEALKKNTITARDLSLHQLRAICTAFQDLIQRQDSQTSQTGKESGGQQ